MSYVAHANLRPDIQHHGSLRERKKARTRAAIRQHALRLFREQGYAATTTEQIAAAAEVSPSTFFRYFPTKEDVVLHDGMDVRLGEALERQPPSLSTIAAIRAASMEAIASLTPQELDSFRVSAELTLTVPEVRARGMDEIARTMEMISAALARRAGQPASDLSAQVVAGAVVGVIMSVTMPWAQFGSGETDVRVLLARIDEGLALLESGLPL